MTEEFQIEKIVVVLNSDDEQNVMAARSSCRYWG